MPNHINAYPSPGAGSNDEPGSQVPARNGDSKAKVESLKAMTIENRVTS